MMNRVTRFTDYRGDGVQRELVVGAFIVSSVFAYRDGHLSLDETCVFGPGDYESSVVGRFDDHDAVVATLCLAEGVDSQ